MREIVIRAIQITKSIDGTEVNVDVQINHELRFRRIFSEEVVDGVLISRQVLPLEILASKKIDH